MRVVEERKIYIFAEERTTKKISRSWDNWWNSNGSGNPMRQKSRVWVGLEFQPYPDLQSAPKAPELSRRVPTTISNQKPAKRTDPKGGKKSRIEKYRKCRKIPAALQQPARILISLTFDHLFVLVFLYVFQETWSKMLALEWAKTHTGVQRNKFQKLEKMELPAPEIAEATGS